MKTDKNWISEFRIKRITSLFKFKLDIETANCKFLFDCYQKKNTQSFWFKNIPYNIRFILRIDIRSFAQHHNNLVEVKKLMIKQRHERWNFDYRVNLSRSSPRLCSIIKQLCNVYSSRGRLEENCFGLRNESSLFPYDINNESLEKRDIRYRLLNWSINTRRGWHLQVKRGNQISLKFTDFS